MTKIEHRVVIDWKMTWSACLLLILFQKVSSARWRHQITWKYWEDQLILNNSTALLKIQLQPTIQWETICLCSILARICHNSAVEGTHSCKCNITWNLIRLTMAAIYHRILQQTSNSVMVIILDHWSIVTETKPQQIAKVLFIFLRWDPTASGSIQLGKTRY